MDKEVSNLYALYAYSARCCALVYAYFLNSIDLRVKDISHELSFFKSNRKAAVTSIYNEHQAMRSPSDFNRKRYVEIIKEICQFIAQVFNNLH